jgi:putative transposase
VTGLSKSTFYYSKHRSPTDAEIRRLLLRGVAAGVDARSRATCGKRRIKATLALERSLIINKKLITLIMRELQIHGLPAPQKSIRNLVNVATYEDLVNRNFQAGEANTLWLTHITEHPTRERKVYCFVVLDLYSRKVVGWAIDRRCEAKLVNDALSMAAGTRATSTSTVIHSDHGSQGEFKESSQHLETEVVGSGNRKATGSCSRDARSDVVARSTVNSPSRGSHQVLGSNRTRVVE